MRYLPYTKSKMIPLISTNNLKSRDELADEYYDEKWYQILDRLASCWVEEGKGNKGKLEIEYKLGLFRSPKGILYADMIKQTYGII